MEGSKSNRGMVNVRQLYECVRDDGMIEPNKTIKSQVS